MYTSVDIYDLGSGFKKLPLWLQEAPTRMEDERVK